MDWLADDFDDFEDYSDTHAVPETLYDSQVAQRNDTHYTDAGSNISQNDKQLIKQSQTSIRNAQLKPTSALPDVFRPLFKFGVFNAMQSQVYDAIMKTTANLVVSAPTGSGKTVLFELAVIHLLSRENAAHKCVYMAPTKALCSERFRDWTQKFNVLGIKCCELTGDTVEFNSNALSEAKDSTIIITTPEKFDSLSRNWRDNCNFLSQIGLFLIDEVHILNDARGSTLEVVTSRMKIRASLRFIVVSATVPNIQDVAEWIGNETSTGPARIFTFGDQYRPCRLSRFVYGFPRRNQNEFSFDRSLDYRLLPLLQEHAENKPILIFCSTRKGTVVTAETLVKEYIKLLEAKQPTPWTKPRRIDTSFEDQKLQELASYGVGVHHAGLRLEDRRLVEDLFLKKIIQVVVATSTLAVGVNLPAHTVVVKGVKTWQNGGWRQYSELDFIQMIGRAGRPQFDQEGIAIVLCDTDEENKYRSISNHQTCLESCLHNNLAEHLNSEIGLRTVTNLTTAKKWLHNSFLFHRIQKNPRHYALDKSSDQTWQSRLDELVESSLSDLQGSELIAMTKNAEYTTTEYGDIMSKFYIRLNTMKNIINLPKTANIREILQTIANAEELSELRLRAGEKQVYRKLSEHNDIRFPIKVEKAADKIFILIQAVLGGLPLNSPEYKTHDSQVFLEAITVLKHSVRIARTIVEVALVRRHGLVLKAGMELIRSLAGKAWEDRPIVLRQIEHIGEKSIKVLALNNITTFAALRKAKASQLELLLNRRPPFGTQILSAVSALPQYCLDVLDSCIQSSGRNKPIIVELTIECKLSEDTSEAAKSSKRKGTSWGMTSILTITNEFDFVDFRRIPTRTLRHPKVFSVTVAFEKPSQSVLIIISPDNYAGLSVTKVYKPSISAEKYPIPNTKPLSYDVDEILAGLEDDPTFWQTTLDDSDEIPPLPPKTTKKDAGKTKLNDSGKKSAVPSKLLNGNYECSHTCKRKDQCRHLCCRDGLPRPPDRKSASSSRNDRNTSNPQQQVSRKQPSSSKSERTRRTLSSKADVATKSLTSSKSLQLSFKKQPIIEINLPKIQPVDMKELEEPISTDSDEDLPAPNDIFEHPGEISDHDIIIIQDSDSEKSMAAEGTMLDLDFLSTLSGNGKRATPSSPSHWQQSKRRKLDIDKTPFIPENRKDVKEKTNPTRGNNLSLFLPSSPDERGEETITISQPFALDTEMDDNRSFLDEHKSQDEKGLLDNKKSNEESGQPLDGYARDYAELCAWLVDATE